MQKKINDFFSQFKKLKYTRGEILVRADDDPQGIYFVLNGEVKMYSISSEGEESVLTIFKESSFFPMSWAITNISNKYYYEALTTLDVIRAPADQVIIFIKQNPDVLYDLLTRVYEGIDGLSERLVYLMSGSAYERLILEILINLKRFGKKIEINNVPSWEIVISEMDLAAQTGLTRETVSRELKILKDKKIVSYQRMKLIVSDLYLLEAELN